MTGFRLMFDRIGELGELPVVTRVMASVARDEKRVTAKRRKIVSKPRKRDDIITPHVLRHSFASVAMEPQYSEATIGVLIGHKGQGVTRQYIHAADAVLVAAADRVENEIAWRMAELRVRDQSIREAG